MTFDELVEATGATPANAIRYAEPLSAAMALFAIDTPRKQAALLGQLVVESVNFSKVEEDLYYKDAVYLAGLYPRAFKNAAEAQPYTRNSKGLSQKLYNGYHGRGLIQLTWDYNYRDAGQALGIDFMADPSLVEQPSFACLTACWFFNMKGCLAPAERGDIREVTRLVNGPKLMHLDRRITATDKALKVLA